MLISHILGEVLETCDRIVVMRDGKVVAADASRNFNRAKLVAAMGGVESEPAPRCRGGGAAAKRDPGSRPPGARRRRQLVAHEGEIVGLAGLAGHGQSDFCSRLSTPRRVRGPACGRRSGRVRRGRPPADGVFPQWSIAHNIGVRSLRTCRWDRLFPRPEKELAHSWRERIGIRTPDVDHDILSLSGGNQQKALFARALASDARVVLMDDPMRGVDYGTKLEVYDLIRAEAARAGPFSGTRPRPKN